MIERENTSVDVVKQDTLTGEGEAVESTTVAEGASSDSASGTPTASPRSTSTKLEEDDVLYASQTEHSVSVDSIDFKPSKRYSITLEMAKKRALRAVKRARERNSSLLDDEGES